MPYPYDLDTIAAIDRLANYYDGGDYNASTNPGGFGEGGHRTNFIPSLQDLALVADSVSDAADAANVFANAAAASATSASTLVAQLQGTSTTSVSIGTGTKGFTTQTGKSFNVGTYLFIVSDADPTTHFMEGQVTAYDSGTGALTINSVVSGGSGSRSDWTIYGRVGAPGVTGPTGATGPQGQTPAFQWNFSNATADTDPGNGNLAFNNASFMSATLMFVDNLDRNSATQTAFLDSFDDSTNTTNFGLITLMNLAATAYASAKVTGAVVDGIGYRKIAITPVMSFGSFTNGAAIILAFYPAGDKGIDGAGAGDVISDIGSTTNGCVCIFNGTTAKHITAAGGGISTSGHNLVWADGTNTWSGTQSFNATLDAQQQFRVSGDISPTQITANQNDYAPTGNATATVWRLSTDAPRTITGIAGGADGRILYLLNVGSQALILAHESASSTAANRITLGAAAGSDVNIGPAQMASLVYDATSTRWRCLFHTGLAGVGSVTRPTYSFADDPDSGLYRIGANNLGIAVNGVKALDIAPSAWGFSGPSSPVFTLTNTSASRTYTFLTAGRTYFVKTSGGGGSDSNDGLTTGTAWATLQKAADVIATLHIPAGQTVDIDVENGTYTGNGTNPLCAIDGWSGSGEVRFLGDLTTPSNVVLDGNTKDVFFVDTDAVLSGRLQLRGFQVQSTVVGHGVKHGGFGMVRVGDMRFGTCAVGIMTFNYGAMIETSDTLTLIAGSTYDSFIDADAGAIQTAGSIVRTSGSAITVNNSFARARYGGRLVHLATIVTSGSPASVTGARFSVSDDGIINTQNRGLDHFPGSVAGVLSSGGAYDGLLFLRQAKFNVYNATTESDVTGNNETVTVDWDTEITDNIPTFASDTYTAEFGGSHLLGGGVGLTGLTTATVVTVIVVTSNRSYQVSHQTASQAIQRFPICVPAADMDAGDTATVTVNANGAGATVVDVQGFSAPLVTFFQGAHLP